MKCLFTLFICIGAAWPMYSYAQLDRGDQESAEAWDVRESALEVYEVKTETPADASTLADEEIVTKKGVKFTLRGNFIDKESQLRLSELPIEKQKNFHQIRLTLITRMAAILNSQRLTIGVAIATKDKIVALFKKKNLADDKLVENIEGQLPVVKPTLREQGQLSVEKILNNINHKFWSEAANVADAKEVTVYLNPTGHVVLTLPKMKAGAGVGALLGIGYNKETDVLFLDILATFEKIKSGFAAQVVVKALFGVEFNSNTEKAPLFKVQRGERHYPVMVPIWEGKGPGVYTAGVSLALSIPTAPFTDPFHYRTEFKKVRLLRLGINTLPLWTLVYNAFSRVHASEKILERFEKKARLGVYANSCPRLF
jgi:hypothetical protein